MAVMPQDGIGIHGKRSTLGSLCPGDGEGGGTGVKALPRIASKSAVAITAPPTDISDLALSPRGWRLAPHESPGPS